MKINSIYILILFCIFSVNLFAEREARTPKEQELVVAVTNNDTTSIYRLIKENVAVNITDKYKKSLLMFAIQNNNKELVKLLVKKGANPNYRIKVTYTDNSSYLEIKKVLDFGIKSNDTEMVDLLIKLGTKLDIKDKSLGSSVAKASLANNVDMVKYLLKKGAEVSDKVGQYLVMRHMKNCKEPIYNKMFIHKNTDFRLIKIWEDYGIPIDVETLTETKLLQKKDIAKYISAYKKWKANGCPDPEHVQKKQAQPEEVKQDTLSEETKARIAKEKAQIREENEIRIKNELGQRKKLATFFIFIIIVSISIIFRKIIAFYSKQMFSELNSLFIVLFVLLSQKFNQIKQFPKTQYRYIMKSSRLLKNKIAVLVKVKGKLTNNEENVGKQIDSSDKGWTVDDTIQLEVNYLTIEDTINPIRMTNEHERYVREMIWYVRRIEKTNENKKDACDALTDKWKKINSKQVRNIYKRSLLIILENYSQQNSRINLLIKQVKAKI